jgi:predicted HTH transcriptional regulator
VDKVVSAIEQHQLPAPDFRAVGDNTRTVLYAPRPLTKMDKADRVRACYQHACLRYVNGDALTNASLRERFGIEPQNAATASRLIKDAVAAGLIRPHDPDAPRSRMRYLPFWA